MGLTKLMVSYGSSALPIVILSVLKNTLYPATSALQYDRSISIATPLVYNSTTRSTMVATKYYGRRPLRAVLLHRHDLHKIRHVVTPRARSRDRQSRSYDATGLWPTYILNYAITGWLQGLPDRRSTFPCATGCSLYPTYGLPIHRSPTLCPSTS